MDSLRRAFALSLMVLSLLVSGCDTAPTPFALANLSSQPSQTFYVRGDGGIDLRFEPMNWSNGQFVAVSVMGGEVRSTAGPTGSHTLSWTNQTVAVQRIVGYLGGQVQAAFDPAGGSDGGNVTRGPTSIHRIKSCAGTQCTYATEYDYELSDPGGSGTAAWSRPGGPPVVVDRVRFQVADQSKESSLLVTSPETLHLVQ